MRYHIVAALLLISALIQGCREDERKLTTPLAHFDKTVELTVSKTIDFEALDILKPRDITINSKYLLIRDFGASEGRFCALDVRTGKVYRELNIGQGPDDVTSSARPFVTNDTLLVADSNQGKILLVDVVDDRLVVVGRKPFTARGGFGRCFLSGNKALMVTSFDSLLIKLTTVDGRIISSLGYPTEGVLSAYPYNLQNTIYLNSIVAVSPDESKFSLASMSNSLYCFGRIEGDALVLERQILYPDMQVRIREVANVGYDILLPEHESPANVIDGFGTKNHVAYLYCGKEMGKSQTAQTILVYDWSGKPVMALNAKEGLSNILYDSKRNVIVGIAKTPEAIYVEYSLEGIIEL